MYKVSQISVKILIFPPKNPPDGRWSLVDCPEAEKNQPFIQTILSKTL